MTENKTYEIVCKLNPAVRYSWVSKINRDTENNNALVKVSPAGMAALQSRDASLTSHRAILKKLCALMGIAWSDDFVKYGLEKEKPAEAVHAPVAVADSKSAQCVATFEQYLNQCQAAGTKVDRNFVMTSIMQAPEIYRGALLQKFLPDVWTQMNPAPIAPAVPTFTFK
jgi:hypothetical protein